MKYQISIHIKDDTLDRIDKVKCKRAYLILFKMIGDDLDDIMKEFYELYKKIINENNLDMSDIIRGMHTTKIDNYKCPKWVQLFSTSAFYKGNPLL